MKKPIDNKVVAIARNRAAYERDDSRDVAPEIGGATSSAEMALHRLFQTWGLDLDRHGLPDWNPLSELIPPASNVVIKPNWVFHQNQRGPNLDCLVTHSSVVEGVAKYVGLTQPAILTIGDAPIQGCDFEKLRTEAGINTMAERLQQRGQRFQITDFRRTIRSNSTLIQQRAEGVRGLEHFVLFDLAGESLLEPLSADAWKFRVTMYNPNLLQRTHAPGRHQYLIAREVIEANVIINLPKLKCHRKACVTGALKNLVGINGNKEYLPHHRKGGSENGGDCYAGSHLWKSGAEGLRDAANRRPVGLTQAALSWMAATAERVAARFGADENLEGSWYGNDTIWRTCLDLQRILRYGKPDGTLAATPQRSIISITDSIIGGEGEGPLGNTPVPSGFLTASLNPAAAEWVHARLMGFDPKKIPLIREAFGNFHYPVTNFAPDSVRVCIGKEEKAASEMLPFEGRAFVPPRGWQGHCELAELGRSTPSESTRPTFIPVTE